MKAMQDEKDFPQRGRNATFLPGARITEIFFTSSALFQPEGDKLISFFSFFLFFFLVFHKRSYFSLTFFSDKTTTKFLSNFEENWGQAEEIYGMAGKVFILSVSPGQNLSFWQCLGEEKILILLEGRKSLEDAGVAVKSGSIWRRVGLPKLLTHPCCPCLLQPFARGVVPRGQVPHRGGWTHGARS